MSKASEARILQDNPLTETETILRDEYYGVPGHRDRGARRAHSPIAKEAAPEAAAEAVPVKPKKPKPTHYKVVCISLYTQDIENLEAKVAELKRRGHTKANKSQLIRMALRQLDLDKLALPQQ